MAMVVGVNVSEISYASAIAQIRTWAQAGESRTVYATTVHGVMEALDAGDFREILNQADMLTPDGMPLVWMLRFKGIKSQQRVYGPTLMLHALEMAAHEKISVGFYGADQTTLDLLVARMKESFPALQIVYAYSPPFRPLNDQETAQIRQAISQSQARIVFVGLGCPRQERWAHTQRGFIPAVMICVGAAFDFHAGLKPQAPRWVQHAGLEWFFRLTQEPRRLWRRYLYNNPRFLFWAAMDLLGFYPRR